MGFRSTVYSALQHAELVAVLLRAIVGAADGGVGIEVGIGVPQERLTRTPASLGYGSSSLMLDGVVCMELSGVCGGCVRCVPKGLGQAGMRLEAPAGRLYIRRESCVPSVATKKPHTPAIPAHTNPHTPPPNGRPAPEPCGTAAWFMAVDRPSPISHSSARGID